LERCRLGLVCLDYARYRPDPQAHLERNLFDGQATVAQPDYFGAVEDPLCATDRVPGLGPVVARVFHPRDYSFADDVALEFCHGADDREHGLAHGRAGVQGLLGGYEVDSESAELGQGEHKLLD
jgi:hypothetical protein